MEKPRNWLPYDKHKGVIEWTEILQPTSNCQTFPDRVAAYDQRKSGWYEFWGEKQTNIQWVGMWTKISLIWKLLWSP